MLTKVNTLQTKVNTRRKSTPCALQCREDAATAGSLDDAEVRTGSLCPCLEYSRANSYPWSPFPPRRARPGPGPHSRGEREATKCNSFQENGSSQGQNLALTGVSVIFFARQWHTGVPHS